MSNLIQAYIIRSSRIARPLQLLFMVVLTAFPAMAQWEDGASDPEHEEESGEEIVMRFQYMYEKHAGGPGLTPAPDAYEKAVQEKLRFDQSQALSPTVMAAWTSASPNGMFYQRTGANYIAGRTNSMAFHPTDPNTFYCAAAGGGVWKTTNGGVNWVVSTDNLTSLMSGAVAIDPLNPSTVYFGTGELNFSLDSYYGDGVYKSTNAGGSWVKIVGTTVGSYISQIAVDPSASNIVYLSGSSGVYKSTNSGSTWSSTGSGTNAMCIIIDPTSPSILYTATGGSSAGLVRKSTDGGSTWATLSGGLPTSSVGRTQLAMAASDHNVLYASISNTSSALLGLYRTTDGGTTWTSQATTPNYMSSQGWYDNAVCVNPADPNMVLAGGLDIYRSTTGGTGLAQVTSWSTSSSSNMSHADIHFLGYNGTVLYCGSDGGVYKSTNNGTSWTDLNATLSTLQYQSADYDPTAVLKLYGGTQDNNKQTSTDGGVTWIQRTTGDGGYTIVDPLSPNYVYGQYVYGSCQRSANSGVSFTDFTPTGASGGLFYNPYEMAPGDPNTIVYGVAQVWKTTTARTATSASWTQIAASGTLGGNTSAIGIGWTSTNAIYVGTSNGRIIATTDNGTNWTATTGYPYVSDLAVDPTNDNICYASFTGTSSVHVYKTTNAGVSWSNITSNLPNIPTNTIVVVPQTPRWLFVGTDLGVYYSTNDGSTWSTFSTGLPTLTIYDLKYKDGPKLLLAATHGRGCYMNDLSSLFVESVAVASPNGGESWVIGSSQAITWTSSGVSGNVKIDLSTDGGVTFPTPLFASTPNDGTESWTVSGPASTVARVRAVSVDNASIRDSSNANFAMVQATMSVSSPNGGENWAIGSSQTISWSSTNLPAGNVKLELSTDSGSTFPIVLSTGTANDGTEAWTVTGPVTGTARIRVTSLVIPTITDASNANFAMVQPTMTMISPNGGESWYIGSSQAITWTSSNLPAGNVKIELSTNSGSTFPTTLFASTPNDGTEAWTVSGPASTTARIRVSSLVIPAIVDAGDANFSILQSTMTVTMPNGAELWGIGSVQTIAWIALGIPGNVKVELSRNGGGSYEVLYGSTPNDGTEQWTVTGPGTIHALIKVTSLNNPSVADSSNSEFVISSNFALLTKVYVRNAGTRSDSLEFGTGAGATDGIDALFGETELPPVPPTEEFDVRWRIPGTEGAMRDVKDTLGGSRLQVVYTGKLQSGTAGYPIRLQWNVAELPSGSFFVRDEATGGGLFNVDMKSQDTLVITNPAFVTFQIVYFGANTAGSSLSSGWNMVSVPVTMPDRRKSVVFPTASTSAFGYSSGGYIPRDTLQYGEGYWLKFPSAQGAYVSGALRPGDTVQVQQGWNMIGSISDQVSIGSVVQIPPGIVLSPYWMFNGVTYTQATSIDPMRAYWVKVSQNGKLALTGGALARPQMETSSEPK